MLFSIITVTYNAAKVLNATLKSVEEQSFRDFEYLVIDGASTDETLSLVEQAGIATTTVWSEPDKGLYDAMNKAIDRAQGQYLIFLNAGDAFATPETLAHIALSAQDHPDCRKHSGNEASHSSEASHLAEFQGRNACVSSGLHR